LITELRWNELAASMRVEVEKDIRLDVNSVTGGAPHNGQEKAKDPTANLFWVVDTIESTLQGRARGPRFLFYVLIPAVLFGALSFVITTLGGIAYLASCALVMTASVKVGRNIIRSRQQRTYLECRSSLLACLVTAKLTDEELVTRVAVRRRGRTLRALFLADSDAKGLIAAVSSS
jgi:hypothetical protein